MNRAWKIRLAILSLGTMLGISVAATLPGMRLILGSEEHVHLSTDWSHRHLVYSAPKGLIQQFQLSGNVRYVQQWVRRKAEKHGTVNGGGGPQDLTPNPDPSNPIHRDWSLYVGSGGTVGAENYPAKYSFNATSADCNNDFVVYNNNLSPNVAATFASATGTLAGLPTNAQTATITNNNLAAPNSLAVYANTGALSTASGSITVTTRPAGGDTVTVGSVTYTFKTTVAAGTQQVLRGASNIAAAQNLQAALDDNSGECATGGCFGSGITAANPAVTQPVSRTTNVISLTAATAGAAGNFTLSVNNTDLTTAGGANGGGSNTGLNFLVGSLTTTATNMAAAIARNGASIGVTASSTGAVTTVTSTNSGAGAAGGDVDISLATSLANFSWAATSLSGGGAGASIVAFNNLYSGCGGTVPSPFWAYNTGGVIATSVTLSFDGTQVAFVQNVGTTGTLVLLKWKAQDGTVDAPTTPTAVTAANYKSCTAPCMTSLPFPAGGTITDTNSSPFYDYADDVLYAGDDGGHLLKFNNVFNGTPTQQATGGFPVAIANGGVLTSPVFDLDSGKVFVASSSGRLTAVLASTGAQTQSRKVGGTGGIFDAPLVDPTNGNVYIITSDTNQITTNGSGIYQFATGFAANANGTLTIITADNPGTAIYDGSFDNAFYNGGAGHLYVCGPAAANATPTLYQIDVTATGILGAVQTGPALATGVAVCSGITEVDNPNASGGEQDLIFVSVENLGQTASPISCPANSGCLMSFNVVSGANLTPTTTAAATISVTGGASGVSVDNTVAAGTLAGASEVYYTPLGKGVPCATSGTGVFGGCAIQASQSGLN